MGLPIADQPVDLGKYDVWKRYMMKEKKIGNFFLLLQRFYMITTDRLFSLFSQSHMGGVETQ